MIKSFNKEEKIALIGVIKFLINSDGLIRDEEIEKIHELSMQKGFEDFQDVFNDADRTIKSITDLQDALYRIHDNVHKKDFVKVAAEIALSDAVINYRENAMLKYLCDFWKLNIDDLL